jgi:formylglycine-generating enzyme required for sulfatase activity
VTWYGASAYARYFDKRLPTEDEWEYAAKNISLQRKRIKASIRTTEEIPPPNKFGLENIGGSIKEWVVRVMDGRKSGQIPVGFSYSSLVVGKSFPTKEPGPQGLIKNFSYPWEGFFDVGFRCAANANLN